MNVFKWRLSDLVIAAGAIAARLPFLLRADRFFDADEAVEGLMARHLGDHSFFFWGQRYKGTPEVFLTSALFHAAAPGVVALKAVTLACFVVFLCVNFRLLERVLSRRVAWMATALFIIGPPSLVLWTLSGSAEIVMTLLAGSVLLLALETGSLYVACAAIGFGLWIHQYILYYVVAVAIALAIRPAHPAHPVRPARPARPTLPALPSHPALRIVLGLFAAVAGLYVVLGLVAFFGSGFDARIAGVRITATHPQKMWWIAGAIVVMSIVVTAVVSLGRQLVLPALAFLAGYSPAIIGRIGNTGLGAPISRLDFSGLRHAAPDITNVMLPILFGWRDPAGHPTVYPALALVLVLLLVVSYWVTWRRRQFAVFHLFPFIAAAMFLASGSYIDAQSYRYLMPIYAALPAIYAVGIDGVWRMKPAGSVLLALTLMIFAAQQIDWYVRLEPDRQTGQAISCLERKGITAARAPYWRSYTITFLTGERIIVSPTDGVDRYPPYSEITRNAPTLEELCPSPPAPN